MSLPVLKQALRRSWRRASVRVGRPVRMETEDRRVLEDVLLPALARDPEVKRVLFVGCDWYTAHYSRYFTSPAEFWTVDPESRQRLYGSPRRHRVIALADAGTEFSASSFDAVVCNGVVGFGIDTADDARASFAAARAVIRPRGLLVLGWNDLPERVNFDVDRCVQQSGFEPAAFPPYGVTAGPLDGTPMRHTFFFYRSLPGEVG